MDTFLNDKINELVLLHNGAKNASNYFFTDIIQRCPVETRDILPGKLYIFKYFPKGGKKIYDAYPFIMALGPDKIRRNMFYGIDAHHIPYKIRIQIFGYIRGIFADEIEKNITEFPEPEDAPKQKGIKEINTDLITKSPFDIDISPSIHKYDMKYVSDCRCVNYKLLPYILLSDDDYFMNGSIRQAQEEFMEKCAG